MVFVTDLYVKISCPLTQSWIVQVWKLLSRDSFQLTCLPFLAPFQRETKCPTSPPASPLTRSWWWDRFLNGSLFINPLCYMYRKRWQTLLHFLFVCVTCLYIRWVAEGSGCSAKVSGQEESGSGAGRQQCWSSYPTVPCLHTVRHTEVLQCARTQNCDYTFFHNK